MTRLLLGAALACLLPALAFGQAVTPGPAGSSPGGAAPQVQYNCGGFLCASPLNVTNANTVEQYNGTTAQSFNIYNTRTDASNYESALFDWSGNSLLIGTQKAGTGVTRPVVFEMGGSSAWTIDTSSNLKPTGGGYVSSNFHTVSGLATCNASAKGARDMVTDGSVVASGNFGAAVATGASNVVPVYCDGTSWKIG